MTPERLAALIAAIPNLVSNPRSPRRHDAPRIAGIAAAWDQATHITTAEQLDRLPHLSIVRDTWTSAAGLHHSGIWERRHTNWHCIAAPLMPPGHDAPILPARLIWNPEWSAE
jgi:hypothetical protein